MYFRASCYVSLTMVSIALGLPRPQEDWPLDDSTNAIIIDDGIEGEFPDLQDVWHPPTDGASSSNPPPTGPAHGERVSGGVGSANCAGRTQTGCEAAGDCVWDLARDTCGSLF